MKYAALLILICIFLGILLISLLFKIMHWPGYSFLRYMGLMGFVFTILAGIIVWAYGRKQKKQNH